MRFIKQTVGLFDAVLPLGWMIYGLVMLTAMLVRGRGRLADGWFLAWLALIVFICLAGSGFMAFKGRRGAISILMFSVLMVLLWSGDVLLFFLWRSRFDVYFWAVLANGVVAMATLWRLSFKLRWNERR